MSQNTENPEKLIIKVRKEGEGGYYHWKNWTIEAAIIKSKGISMNMYTWK